MNFKKLHGLRINQSNKIVQRSLVGKPSYYETFQAIIEERNRPPPPVRIKRKSTLIGRKNLKTVFRNTDANLITTRGKLEKKQQDELCSSDDEQPHV